MHNPPNCIGYCLECEYDSSRWENVYYAAWDDPVVHVGLMAGAVRIGLTKYDADNNNNMRIGEIETDTDEEGRPECSFTVATVNNRKFDIIIKENPYTF